MYCHYCGSRITGPYCKICVSKKENSGPGNGKSAEFIKNNERGNLAHQPPAGTKAEIFRSGIQNPSDLKFPSNQADSWENEVRYEKLMAIPRIRETIFGYASTSKSNITGEELLGNYDKANKPFEGSSVSKVGNKVQQIYSSIGVNTGKTLKERVKLPAGLVILRVLCSLAKNGQLIRKVEQAEDGCLINAFIPSDLLNQEGLLDIKVQNLGMDKGTFIEAATHIPGQLYDWGQSKRLLNRLMRDVQELPV